MFDTIKNDQIYFSKHHYILHQTMQMDTIWEDTVFYFAGLLYYPAYSFDDSPHTFVC